jgi:hypothetical protein
MTKSMTLDLEKFVADGQAGVDGRDMRHVEAQTRFREFCVVARKVVGCLASWLSCVHFSRSNAEPRTPYRSRSSITSGWITIAFV